MPDHGADPMDPRSKALSSHPPDQPFSERPAPVIPEVRVPGGPSPMTDLLGKFQFRSSLPSSPRSPQSPTLGAETASDGFKEENVGSESASGSPKVEGIGKMCHNIVRGSPAIDRLACSSVSDSPSVDYEEPARPSSRERYWGLRFARRVKESKEKVDTITGLGISDIDFKVCSTRRLPIPQPITREFPLTSSRRMSMLESVPLPQMTYCSWPCLPRKRPRRLWAVS